MKKYPRTYHFQFSPEIKDDDKVISFKDLGNFLDEEIIITEKLDGGNTTLKPFIGIFARSHSTPTSCETFDYIKNVHFFPKQHLMNETYEYCGENLFAIHSIEYENLKDYFYLFNIYDKKTNEWLSFDEVILEANKLNFETVPILFKGKIESISWLNKFLDDEIKKSSFVGGKREGFVVRINKRIKDNEFQKKIGKYVRKGHVQTDTHWSKNWKQALLNKENK